MAVAVDDYGLRRTISGTLNLPYVALKRQLEAHLHPANGPEQPLLYGGAEFGGKSYFLIADGIREMREVPDNLGLLCRFESSVFNTNLRAKLERLIQPLIDSGEVVHQASRRRYWWPKTKSALLYGGVRGSGGKDNLGALKGEDYGWIGLDEVTDFPYEVFYTLAGRLRRITAREMGRLKLRCTCNPEPGWVRDKFITQAAETGWAYIQARAYENPYGGLEHVALMRRTYPPEVFDAWIEGNWFAFSPTNATFPEGIVLAAMQRADVPPDWDDLGWAWDVADTGGDRNVLGMRAGLYVDIRWDEAFLPVDEAADSIAAEWAAAEHKPGSIAVDADGLGKAAFRMLQKHSRGGRLGTTQLWAVHGNGRPTDTKTYLNKRTELGFELRHWLEQEPVRLPNRDDLRTELTADRYETKTKLRRMPKEFVSGKLGHSPDLADTVILLKHVGPFFYAAGSQERAARRRQRAADAARLGDPFPVTTAADLTGEDLSQRGYPAAAGDDEETMDPETAAQVAAGRKRDRERAKAMRNVLKQLGKGGFGMDYDVE